MIKPSDVIAVPIPPPSDPTWATIVHHARSAALGGRSSVRGGDRQERLLEDQLVGQIGQWAGTIILTGSSAGYLAARDEADAHPWDGDGGADLLGTNVDFKCSAMRGSADPLRYRLAVRPTERHPGNVYVLLLVHLEPRVVYGVGWARDEALPPVETRGTFEGAHVLPAWKLCPLLPCRWPALEDLCSRHS